MSWVSVARRLEEVVRYLADKTSGGSLSAAYYVRAYESVRAKETVISGAEPVMVVIHDAFQPVLNVCFSLCFDTYFLFLLTIFAISISLSVELLLQQCVPRRQLDQLCARYSFVPSVLSSDLLPPPSFLAPHAPR